MKSKIPGESMPRDPKIYEEQLYEIWEKQKFSRTLQTVGGDDIEILETGDRNVDTAGPDYLNAKVRIGDMVYLGDVELDSDYNDWKTHGHNINKKHNKLVLHLSLVNSQNHPYVYTKDGRKIPTVCLSRFIDDNFAPLPKGNRKSAQKKKLQLKCISLSDQIDLESRMKYVSEQGIIRFKKKIERIFNRLKELAYLNQLSIKEPIIRYDLKYEFDKKKFSVDDFGEKKLWQQLLYEFIFEALGYTQNKGAMVRLAQSLNLDALEKFKSGDRIRYFESLFFNVSGLAPDPRGLPETEVSDYSRRLYSDWEKLRNSFDGEILSETDWHFFRLRPRNFPTIRIAAGVRIIESIIIGDLIGGLIRKIKLITAADKNLKDLRKPFIIEAEGYWKEHYIFDHKAKEKSKYFVGSARADEIVINVVLPFFSLYFDLFDNEELSRKCLMIYSNYEGGGDNKITKTVAEGLNLEKHRGKTVISQGMIELYKNYCSKDKCTECALGKIIFL